MQELEELLREMVQTTDRMEAIVNRLLEDDLSDGEWRTLHGDFRALEVRYALLEQRCSALKAYDACTAREKALRNKPQTERDHIDY